MQSRWPGPVGPVCEHVFVRWDEQAVEREDEGRLPGVGPGTVVRTFDAPEAMGINFHEVGRNRRSTTCPGCTSASTRRSTFPGMHP